MNNYSEIYQEFEKRYKYCYEKLENHYKECFTCDVKTDEWMNKYWLEKAENLNKIIKELQLCAHDAKYMAENFKKENL